LAASLLVIGVNHRTSPVAARERFWMNESGMYEALNQLRCARGIEEAVVLVTCNRTEFILWAADTVAAASAVREYLAARHGLVPDEWENFYRFEADGALRHIFRVAASLDSMVVGEPEITGQVKAAWTKAQKAGATGRFLDTVFQKALSVSKRVRNETTIGAAAVSVPYAAVELAKQIFGSLEGRRVLVLGAGKMGELSARYLIASGAAAVWVTNRTFAHAVELAGKLGGAAVPFEERWQHLAASDIVISSTGCPHVILSRQDAERIHRARQGRPVFLIDIAVPRDIDPAVRQVPGVFLYDIDDLEQVVSRNLGQRHAAAAGAEKIVAREAQVFAAKLKAERVVPTIASLRARLEEIRREEIERYRRQAGPLTPADEELLAALTAQMVQRIATELARELKQAPGQPEQDQLTAAVRRLFHLSWPHAALTAGD
jgi:glutamyl-tRNA reductase